VLSVQLLARILTIYISELVSGKLPPEISYPSRLVHFWTRVLRPQRTWKNIPNWHWTSMNSVSDGWWEEMVLPAPDLRVHSAGCMSWAPCLVCWHGSTFFFFFFFDQDTVALCSHHWHATWPQTPHSRSWCQVSHHVRFHHKGEYDTCTISDWTLHTMSSTGTALGLLRVIAQTAHKGTLRRSFHNSHPTATVFPNADRKVCLRFWSRWHSWYFPKAGSNY